MKVDYTLIRRPRRRSLTITVSPENQVRVIAPGFLSRNKIEDFIHRKSPWILKQIEKNTRRPKPEHRQYETGEKFLFLGNELVLEIRTAAAGDRQGSISCPMLKALIVSVPEKLQGEERRDHIAWRIEDWYRAAAVKIFRERVARYQNLLGPKPRAVRVKEFRGQWGSASRRGNLSFNWRLLLAPLEVLDYVVVHELTHLEHLNHSPRFWSRIEQILPDYKPRRQWLTAHGQFLWLRNILDSNPSFQKARFMLS